MALPFVCVVFGLVGAALGTTQHTGRATGFGISVVVIFSYYLNFISDALGVAILSLGCQLGCRVWLV